MFVFFIYIFIFYLISKNIPFKKRRRSHTIYTQIQSSYKTLETQIHDLKEQITKLPPGTLICSQNGKHYKWYQCIDHLKTYISKKNRQLAEQLALKTYLSLLLEDLSHEKRALQFYLDHHYECALQLDEIMLFPDFTIRHPKTGDVYYWEHFGLMDNPVYSQNVCSKLQFYATHGIIPSIKLITTYESKDNPLNPDMVQKIITHYFLQ